MYTLCIYRCVYNMKKYIKYSKFDAFYNIWRIKQFPPEILSFLALELLTKTQNFHFIRNIKVEKINK